MTAKTAPRETELTFLRLVPGDSLVHRLWAGTKLIVAAVLAVIVSISPSWQSLAVVSSVVFAGLLLAHIPMGAFPRLPRWFWIALAIGGATSALGSTKPIVHVGSIALSLGGVSDWLRLTLLAAILVLSGALVGWTTPLGEIAPAIARLTSPLRRLRVPVDEWIVAIAVAIRCLPLLLDEVRTLAAARRLRVSERTERMTLIELIHATHDLLSTAIVVSIRRARDLGEAMIARGGLGGAVADKSDGPGRRDAAVLVVVAAIAGATLFLLLA